MAYNRYQQQSSPWASGAPPMYGSHAPPPPPQYGAPAYGHSSAPWNVTPAMRQSGGGWGTTNTPPIHHIQHNQRRGGQQMRGPIPGPTGKRGNMGSWEGPNNKRFAKHGGGRGGQGGGGGGNWRQGGGGGQGGQKFQNRPFNRDNRRNNREVNRSKQNDTQIERRQQHDLAQKAAESLENKEYPIETNANKAEDSKTDDKNKNLEIDSAQEKYLLAVFGYVCQVCSVFLKDKKSRFDHCQSENHLNQFNIAEEERIKKEETEKNEKKDETEVETNETQVEKKTEEMESNDNLKNGEKTETINEAKNEVLTTDEVMNEKAEEEPKSVIENTQEEEIKSISEETPVIAEQPVQPSDESGGKAISSEPLPQTGVETPNPVVSSKPANNYSGGEYTPNRGRGGNYNRGRGGHGGRGGPRGRGRNRGRGRK